MTVYVNLVWSQSSHTCLLKLTGTAIPQCLFLVLRDIQVGKETFYLLAFVIVKLKSIADYCISLNKNDEMQLSCMTLLWSKDMTGEAFGPQGISNMAPFEKSLNTPAIDPIVSGIKAGTNLDS